MRDDVFGKRLPMLSSLVFGEGSGASFVGIDICKPI